MLNRFRAVAADGRRSNQGEEGRWTSCGLISSIVWCLRRLARAPKQEWGRRSRACEALGVSPWKLPLIVAAIVVPIALSFLLVGPSVGLPIGALVAGALVVVAVRQRPRGGTEPAAADRAKRRVLVVIADPLED